MAERQSWRRRTVLCEVAVVLRHILCVNYNLIFVNSILRATHFLDFLEFEFTQFDFLVWLICTVIHRDRFDAFHFTDGTLEDFLAVVVCPCKMATGVSVVVKVRASISEGSRRASQVQILTCSMNKCADCRLHLRFLCFIRSSY